MEIGVAVLSVEQNGRPVTLVVQEFGTRSGVNVPAPVVTRVSHLTQQALEAPAIQGQAVWSGVIRQTDMFQRAFLIGWALVEIGAVMAFWFWKYARPHRQKALA
jgi:hypothetical protein